MEPGTNAVLGRPRRRSRSRAGAGAAMLAALALLTPASASAATSGGWSNLGHGATATSAPLNERVLAMTRVGSKLYVGGQFTNAGGIAAADRVAVWNGSAWAAVGAGLTNRVGQRDRRRRHERLRRAVRSPTPAATRTRTTWRSGTGPAGTRSAPRASTAPSGR